MSDNGKDAPRRQRAIVSVTRNRGRWNPSVTFSAEDGGYDTELNYGPASSKSPRRALMRGIKAALKESDVTEVIVRVPE